MRVTRIFHWANRLCEALNNFQRCVDRPGAPQIHLNSRRRRSVIPEGARGDGKVSRREQDDIFSRGSAPVTSSSPRSSFFQVAAPFRFIRTE